MEEEIMEIVSNMLGSSFQQGMAHQRLQDASEDFNREAVTVGENLLKFKELMNFGEEKQQEQ